MPLFVVQHIDALITTIFGMIATAYGFSMRMPGQQKTAKILRVCGPLVIVFGLLRFLIDQPAAADWQRHTTIDGVASAEFPAPPTAKQQTDTMNGVSSERTSLTYNVPLKDISLFLSFSPLATDEPSMPESERIATMKAFFVQQGFSVVHESPVQLGVAPGFALDLERDAGKVRMWIRVAFAAGKVYRVVVSSPGLHHDDPIIPHFLDSFRIEKSGV
jgi:hypothetical protein